MNGRDDIIIDIPRDKRLEALYNKAALTVGLPLGCCVHPTCNCGECVVRRRRYAPSLLKRLEESIQL